MKLQAGSHYGFLGGGGLFKSLDTCIPDTYLNQLLLKIFFSYIHVIIILTLITASIFFVTPLQYLYHE